MAPHSEHQRRTTPSIISVGLFLLLELDPNSGYRADLEGWKHLGERLQPLAGQLLMPLATGDPSGEHALFKCDE